MIESRRVLIPGVQRYAKMLNQSGFLAFFRTTKALIGKALQIAVPKHPQKGLKAPSSQVYIL